MKPTDLDFPLKIKVSILFRQMGFLPEVGAQITSRSYRDKYAREQLSDYDVLGIRFERDLCISKIAAECKSGERKALEELLKLKGIMAAFGIQRGYFVKTKIHRNAREVASAINISTFDEGELDQLLGAAFGISLSVALQDEERRLAANGTLDAAMQDRFPALHSYLKYEFWNLEARRNLQNLFWFLRRIGPSLKDSEDSDRHLLGRIVLLISIAALEVAGAVLATNLSDPGRGFSVCMFGGARERREREVLFDQVNKLFNGKTHPSLQFEPEYFAELGELIARVIRSAPVSAEIPFFLESACDLYFRGVTTGNLAKFNTVTRKLAQDIFVLASKEGKLPISLAKEIMEL